MTWGFLSLSIQTRRTYIQSPNVEILEPQTDQRTSLHFVRTKQLNELGLTSIESRREKPSRNGTQCILAGFNDKSYVVDLKKGEAKEGESFQRGKLMDLCTPTGYIPQMKAGKMSPTSFIGNNSLLPTGNSLFYLAAGTTSSHQRLRPL